MTLRTDERIRRNALAQEQRAEVARLRIMAAKITHCDHCGSDWVDNGINTGCSCREVARLTADRDAKTARMWELGHEVARLTAENERLRQIAQSAVDMHFKSEAR